MQARKRTGGKKPKVGYQGVDGAYSQMAAREYFGKSAETYGAPTFEHLINEVRQNRADYGFLPIENSVAGRVTDAHHLLAHSKLVVVGEHFMPIKHMLVGVKGAKLGDVKRVYSHPQALAQCSNFLKALGVEAVPFGDTADAVRHIAQKGDVSVAAVASKLAAETYPGATILRDNIQNRSDNVTRFLVIRKGNGEEHPTGDVITSISYTVRNIPAALYKSLSGFATTGINIINLESFVPMTNGGDASFYLEFEGSPDSPMGRVAVEELGYYAKNVDVLGVYKKSPYRKILSAKA